MKISVLVPSERYLETAGVRIRYRRLAEPLAQLGWTLEIIPIDDVPDPSGDDSSIYLFSKCQDARALIVARAARQAGNVVGVDLFDDYFSQQDDARFAAQRAWLRSLAPEASFFLCSTERMLEVGNMYFESGAGHVLGDPYEEFDPVRLDQELAAKIFKAKRERRIPILWFGIADNPNFPVGIHDLSAFGEALRPFNENGYSGSLTILTNTKAIDGRALERLRRLPVPFVIREWSKKREEDALSQSLVSFLPVNFQQFSTAKSLNRGLSALVGGCQVLTAGFPLYDSLGEYVYRDAVALIDDLEKSTLKLSSGKVPEFSRWIFSRASAGTEAERLVAFLSGKTESSPAECDDQRQFAVLHGARSAASINSLAQRLGWLSLGSPLLPGGMKCDAHLGFFGSEPKLKLRVSQAGLDHLPEELRVAAVWADASLGKGPPWEVPLDSLESRSGLEIRRPPATTASAGAALNSEMMNVARAFFATIFEDLCIVESELDPVRCNIRALQAA